MLASTIALTAAIAFLATATPIDGLIDFFWKIAPLLVALGLFHAAAALGRNLWAQAKIAAGKTPTKVDDFLVHIADGPITAALDLLDKGDVDGAKKKIAALKAMVPK